MNFQQHPWSHDPLSKQFSHTRFFGPFDPNTLPETLGRPRIPAENQQQTLRCVAYAAAENGQYIYGARKSPEWQAKKIGEIQGRAVDGYGSDPNAGMKSQCIQWGGGYLPYESSLVTLEKDGVQKSGNPENFSPHLDSEAQDYSNSGFVKPDGGADVFDSIRIALFQAYDPTTKRGACVQAFSAWYDTFSGLYLMQLGKLLGYHSYLFVDWRVLNGRTFLIFQNSYGPQWGDQGYQYMSREVCNQLFAGWGQSVKIVKPLTKEQIALAKQIGPFGELQRAILKVWYALVLKIIELYG